MPSQIAAPIRHPHRSERWAEPIRSSAPVEGIRRGVEPIAKANQLREATAAAMVIYRSALRVAAADGKVTAAEYAALQEYREAYVQAAVAEERYLDSCRLKTKQWPPVDTLGAFRKRTEAASHQMAIEQLGPDAGDDYYAHLGHQLASPDAPETPDVQDPELRAYLVARAKFHVEALRKARPAPMFGTRTLFGPQPAGVSLRPGR